MLYVVLKVDDINKYCSPLGRDRLVASALEVENGRLAEGKKLNHYLVVNADEPYADKVKAIIEEHEGEKIKLD